MLSTKHLVIGSTPLLSLLLLTGCSQSQSPLVEFLEDTDYDNPVVTLTNIYGTEWDEFALVCAGASDSYIADTLGLPVEEVPNLEGSEQSGFIFWNDSSTQSDLLDPSDAVLCNSRTPLARTLTVTSLSFTEGIDGEWLISNPSINQEPEDQVNTAEK